MRKDEVVVLPRALCRKVQNLRLLPVVMVWPNGEVDHGARWDFNANSLFEYGVERSRWGSLMAAVLGDEA